MVKQAFDIVNPGWTNDEWQNAVLLMEVSAKQFSFVISDHEKKRIFCIRKYYLELNGEKDLAQLIAEIISTDEYLVQPVKDVVVLYNFPESNMIPATFYQDSLHTPVTELVYGDTQTGLVLNEKIDGWNIYNVYRVPGLLHSLIRERFASGKYWHYYTLLLTADEKENKSPVCKIIFQQDNFIASIIQDRQLKLIQTFSYQASEDVSYYLLNIFRQLNIQPDSTELNISGMIDRESSLFAEILKYFPIIEWETVPESIDIDGLSVDYPPHYFSPLLKILACVS